VKLIKTSSDFDQGGVLLQGVFPGSVHHPAVQFPEVAKRATVREHSEGATHQRPGC
jgi:hypothetical protein